MDIGEQVRREVLRQLNEEVKRIEREERQKLDDAKKIGPTTRRISSGKWSLRDKLRASKSTTKDNK